MQKFISELDIILLGRSVKPSQCLTSSKDLSLLIEDNKELGKTIFVTNAIDEDYISQHCFEIQNTEQKEIFLWAIDGCFVMKGKPLSKLYPKKCDCAFGYENYIGFVEFKLETNPKANPKTIENNRKEAVTQIEHTILFLKKSLNIAESSPILGYKIEAFLCTPPSYPNKNTSITSLAIEFLEMYGVSLFERSSKECI